MVTARLFLLDKYLLPEAFLVFGESDKNFGGKSSTPRIPCTGSSGACVGIFDPRHSLHLFLCFFFKVCPASLLKWNLRCATVMMGRSC